MGVINHNAVIATTWDSKEVDRVWQWIESLEQPWRGLFSRSESVVNGDTTIFMAPDGSKEGWPQSDDGDLLRNEFISRLENRWAWIEVGYGELGQAVLRGNNENRFNDTPYAG